MRKSSTEKNALMISAENTIQKNEKHDENFKNQNIMLKKKILLTYQSTRFRKDKNVFSITMYRYQDNRNMF